MNLEKETSIYDQTIEYLMVQSENAKVDDADASDALLSAVREGEVAACSVHSELNYNIEILINEFQEKQLLLNTAVQMLVKERQKVADLKTRILINIESIYQETDILTMYSN